MQVEYPRRQGTCEIGGQRKVKTECSQGHSLSQPAIYRVAPPWPNRSPRLMDDGNESHLRAALPRGIQNISHSCLRKWTQQSTTSKSIASCARCEPILSDPCVGGHLHAALPARPIFGCTHQCSADSPIAAGLFNEPPFDETNRLGGIATICMRSQAYLKKTSHCSTSIARYKNCGGHGSRSPFMEDRVEAPGMLFS